MYKCEHCGYEVEELPVCRERLENGLFVPTVNDYCPVCRKGSMQWAKLCLACEEWYCEDEFDGNICEKCFKKLATFDMACKYLSTVGDTYSIGINPILKKAVHELDIDVNSLIYDHIQKYHTNYKSNDELRKNAFYFLAVEGSDAEEFMLKEE